jgi:hypothetical protein
MFPNAFQLTFDFQTPTGSVERRYTTTIPQQRLFFLNNTMVHRQAAALAEKIGETGTEQARVTKAFEIVLQRQPSPEELAGAVEFLHNPTLAQVPVEKPNPTPEAKTEPKTESNAKEGEKTAEVLPPPKDSPMKSLCWALLSSTEFLYLN